MWSVHPAKVSAVTVPVMLVGLLLLVTSASKDVWVQVTPPSDVVRTAVLLEVFRIVVEPVSKPPPGSVRSVVVADADAAPRASKPVPAMAANAASLRIDMNLS
jgi:hypothetical protein